MDALTARDRWDIEEILRPAGGGGAYVDHAIELMLRFGVRVARGSRSVGWAARRALKTIDAFAIETEADYACALHELGHCVDSVTDRPIADRDYEPGFELSIESETYAWTFAVVSAGQRWSPMCHRTLQACLDSYGFAVDYRHEQQQIHALIAFSAERARRVVYFKAPPAIPTAIAPFVAQVPRSY